MRKYFGFIALLLVTAMLLAGGCGGGSSSTGSGSGGGGDNGGGDNGGSANEWTNITGAWKPTEGTYVRGDTTYYLVPYNGFQFDGSMYDSSSSLIEITIVSSGSSYQVSFGKGYLSFVQSLTAPARTGFIEDVDSRYDGVFSVSDGKLTKTYSSGDELGTLSLQIIDDSTIEVVAKKTQGLKEGVMKARLTK